MQQENQKLPEPCASRYVMRRVKIKLYPHPETGKPVTRQRMDQIANTNRGLCRCGRPLKLGKASCEAHMSKLKEGGYGEQYPKAFWKLCVDWSRTNRDLAEELGMSTQSIMYQRKVNKKPKAPAQRGRPRKSHAQPQ